MGHRDPGYTVYGRGTNGAGDVLLLGFSLVSGSSFTVRNEHGSGTAAWITGTLTALGMQGSWQLGQQEIWCSYGFFLVFVSCVSVGIHCEGGVVAWITGTLAMPGTQG